MRLLCWRYAWDVIYSTLVFLWILLVLCSYIYYLLCCSIFFAIWWEAFFCFQTLFLMMRLCSLALGFLLFLLLSLPVYLWFHFQLFPYGSGSIRIRLIDAMADIYEILLYFCDGDVTVVWVILLYDGLYWCLAINKYK